MFLALSHSWHTRMSCLCLLLCFILSADISVLYRRTHSPSLLLHPPTRTPSHNLSVPAVLHWCVNMFVCVLLSVINLIGQPNIFFCGGCRSFLPFGWDCLCVKEWINKCACVFVINHLPFSFPSLSVLSLPFSLHLSRTSHSRLN